MGRRRSPATDGIDQARLRRATLAEGRARRRQLPRSEHAQWRAHMRTSDPIDMLVVTGRSRLKELFSLSPADRRHLGWADDEEGRHYYVRQLRDMKTSIPTEDLQGAVLANYAAMCGWSLARAHAKSGHATRLSGYISTSGKLAESLAQFACSYADQCERDFEAFMQAIRSGLLPAEVESAR
jgi:hypothetical protein